MANELAQRARQLRWLLFDVDGVLCERLYFSAEGELVKPFDAKDGLAIRAAAGAGLKIGIVTARSSAAVERRARDLRFDRLIMGSGNKGESIDALLADEQLDGKNLAYVGDDLPDLPAIARCGLTFAPADAAREVCERVDVVLTRPGGSGAVREMVEMVLRARGEWDAVVARYLT